MVVGNRNLCCHIGSQGYKIVVEFISDHEGHEVTASMNNCDNC